MASQVSGLSNTSNQIVQQLMSIERRPLDALTNKQSSYQTKISSLGKLSSALDSIRSAAEALKNSNNFYAATSSNKDIATAAVSGKASKASYDVNITQLAKSQKLASASFLSVDSAVGSGTLTFSIADKTDQSVTVANGTTLTQLKDAINSQVTGVKASIVQAADGYKLSLTSDSGASSAVKITSSDDDTNNTDLSGLSAFAYDAAAAVGNGKNMTQNQAAQNTIATIDGINIISSTTKISSIPGITIDAKTIGSASITVDADSTAYQDKVKTFVDSYNKAVQTLKDEGKYNSANNTAGVLNGTLSVRTAASELSKLKQTQLTGVFKNLNDVGVVSNSDGTLKIDNARLQKAIENPDALNDFWSLSNFNSNVTTTISGLTGNTGVISVQKNTYDSAIKRIDKQKDQLQVRLDMIEKRYTQQYSKLEAYTNNANSIINLFA